MERRDSFNLLTLLMFSTGVIGFAVPLMTGTGHLVPFQGLVSPFRVLYVCGLHIYSALSGQSYSLSPHEIILSRLVPSRVGPCAGAGVV